MSRDPVPGEPVIGPRFGADGRAEEQAIGTASFILSLRAKGIRDTAVLRAMELVPREVFAPRRFADLARKDVALPLPCGQTMTSPKTVATMLVALGVEPEHKVLEVGTGSGYVTALLAHMGATVTSVERFGALAESAAGHLAAVGIRKGARIEVGDGLALRPRERFDRILLNGAAAEVPAAVLSLLGPEGRLVGALSREGMPRLVRIDGAAGERREELGGPLRISPLLAGVALSL